MNEDRDELIASVAEHLREPVQLSTGFDERVMAEVRGDANGRVLSFRSNRRPLLWGLAGAAIAASLTLLVMRERATVSVPDRVLASNTPTATSDAAAAGAIARPVQFVLYAPRAASVSLAGTFNDWGSSAMPLKELEPGVWSATVPLRPGRYTYSFVVDGTRWVADPSAPRSADDDFGKPGSMLIVGTTP